MGEQSTRSLRAGEMDDVIFAGTAGRPSRNLAEVTLTLDDTAGAVPPPFHEQAELEIVRRIERGAGSAYRVNGKEVRARDVQTLFADLATGAHASGMVSQGRVGALVTAKPEDRRAVLEEAAGITGLHARRHEAELKLRAAEANLARAEDLRGQLEAQLGALKRQARQASRYRNISGAIRQAEAELLAIQRARADAVRAEAEAALHAARHGRRRRHRGRDPGRTPGDGGSRGAAAAARRRVGRPHRAGAPSRGAGADRRRGGARPRGAGGRRHGGWPSLGRTWRTRNSSGRIPQAAEVAACGGGCRAGRGRERARTARARPLKPAPRQATDAVRLAEAEANRATEAAAEAECPRPGRGPAAGRGRAALATAGASSSARSARERDRMAAQAVDPAALEAAGAEQVGCRGRAGGGARAHGRGRTGARGDRTGAGRRARAAGRGGHARSPGWRAEADALAEVLAVKDGERWPPMVDALSVPPGLETALGAALGEELTSAADRDAARHWRRTAAVRPGSQTARQRRRRSPRWCRRRRRWPASLSQIGLVEDELDGEALAGRTGPGPGAGVARRRGLALGRLHDPRRHADRGGSPAAAAQPAVAAAARSGRGARRGGGRARSYATHAADADQAAMAAETAGPRRPGGRRTAPGARTRGAPAPACAGSGDRGAAGRRSTPGSST